MNNDGPNTAKGDGVGKEPPPEAAAAAAPKVTTSSATRPTNNGEPGTTKGDGVGDEILPVSATATPAVTSAATAVPLTNNGETETIKDDGVGGEPALEPAASTPAVTSASVPGGDGAEYDPKVLARYAHYYRTGVDLDRPPGPDDPPPPPPKKKRRKKDIPPAEHEARGVVQHCCRDGDLPRALATFHGALRDLTRLEAATFYQLLNLCEGTFATRVGRAHVGTPKFCKEEEDCGGGGAAAAEGEKEDEKDGASEEKNDENKNGGQRRSDDAAEPEAASTPPDAAPAVSMPLPRRLHHARHIHSLLSSLGLPLTDPAYTALVRLAARAGDFDRAEAYLDEAERTVQCKVRLRTYSCLLRAYCGRLSSTDSSEGHGGGTSSNARETEDSEGGGSALGAVPMTQERLVRALKIWKRLYDNSGGLSTGHPNYHANKHEAGKNEDANNAKLFGEGISPKIGLTELEYTALMAGATALRDVPVMARLFGDVAETVLVPGRDMTNVILDWFRSDDKAADLRERGAEGGGSSALGSSALDHVTLPPCDDPSLLGAVTNENGQGWDIYRGCTVDAATGMLTLTTPEGQEDRGTKMAAEALPKENLARYKLKPVKLTDRAWRAMQDMNKAIVLEGQVAGNISQYQGGGKGKKRGRGPYNGRSMGNKKQNPKRNHQHHDNNNRTKDTENKAHRKTNAWKGFEDFLAKHPPYDTVIDGANVGYFEQNFSTAAKHVDYHQIDWLLRHLLEQPQRQHQVILFLHERHFSSNLAPPWADELFRAWDSDRAPYGRLTVYRTPAGMNDDWFWMHAALAHGHDPTRPAVLTITNDEMRDHHFQMSAPGSFLRWKERHRATFEFEPYDGKQRRREVRLTHPNVYSRRIQWVVERDGDGGGVSREGDDQDHSGTKREAFVVPLPRKGDEGRFADGVHVAEEGVPAMETYFVIEKRS